MKSPEKSVFSSSLLFDDLFVLLLGGVIDRFVGERDTDLVRGGVPTLGGVVVPFIVSFSTPSVGGLRTALCLDLELDRSPENFFPLLRPFGRT